MIIKALGIYEPNHQTGKIEWELRVIDNPLIPLSTRTHVELCEEIDVSVFHKTTQQIVHLKLTFYCMKCVFKTLSLTEIENHSETHVCRRRQ